jgi:chemotaxis protein CheC
MGIDSILIDKSKLLEKRSGDALISSALALSQLTGETVSVVRTVVDVIRLDQIAAFLGVHDGKITLISLDIHGRLSGDIYLVISSVDTEHVTRKVARKWLKEEEIEHFASSVLGEVGNIVASAYINVLGDSFNVALIPSVPQLAYVEAADFVPSYVSAGDGRCGFALMFLSELLIGDTGLKILFFFLLSDESMAYLSEKSG